MGRKKLEINIEELAKKYNEGFSINALGRMFDTYPTTIRRILKKNNIELRHDSVKKGDIIVQDGEKLIEWAKSQGRLVSKNELAKIIGRKKSLSSSYFVKYPELVKYTKMKEQKELESYTDQLYDWLKNHNISYKPKDRSRLGVSVDALLLGEYEEIALQIQIKPKCVSVNNYKKFIDEKIYRAKNTKLTLILLDKLDFDNKLANLEEILNNMKEEIKNG